MGSQLTHPAQSRWESFADVDASGAAPGLSSYLDDLAAIPGVAVAKQRSLDLLELKAGGRVLDVGCGNGPELEQLASMVGQAGRVVGLDRSVSLIHAAKARVRSPCIELVVGDAHVLPFGDGDFDACRADRTLQHLAQPDVGLAEMVRVTRSGGRVAITECRCGLDAPDLDGAVTAAVLGAVSSDKHGRDWLGYLLPMMLQLAGLNEVEFVTDLHHVSDFKDLDGLLNLAWSVKEAVEVRGLDAAQARHWRERLGELAGNGQASGWMLMAHVTGVKP